MNTAHSSIQVENDRQEDHQKQNGVKHLIWHYIKKINPFPRNSHEQPEAVTPGQGWEVRHRLSRKDSNGNLLYIPEQVASELKAKASGAILALAALIVTWSLSALFSTKLGHVGLGGFNAIRTLQFLLWTILRQGMSIVALVAFDIFYTATPRGRRRTISLNALDAWMSLIITPINIFRGKFIHVLLVLLPSLFSIFAAYATSSLLGRETAFELLQRGTQEVVISASGGGSPLRYIMTGQEFVYNASAGCIARPGNRFAFVLSDNKVLVPSIPEIGTYSERSTVRAARINGIPSVVGTISAKVESNRSISPTTNESQTTTPGIGDVQLNGWALDKSSGVIQVQVMLLSAGVHRQIQVQIHYQTTVADLLFATFNNGSHVNRVYDVRNVSEDIPARLNGSKSFEMDSVLDNFILSQNGNSLLKVLRPDDTRVKNLGLILASAFGIRSATLQNWIDGHGARVATVYEEREVVKVPRRYWAVSAGMSSLLAIACLLMCIRRPTINGNLVQVVALLYRYIENCNGACTPNWQKAYADEQSFEDRYMSQPLMLGYRKDADGQRESLRKADSRGFKGLSYSVALDEPERVTRDRLNVLYGLLAG